MASLTAAKLQAGLIGTTLDTTKSGVGILIYSQWPSTTSTSGVEGAVVTMTPKSGDGPFYTATTGLPDMKATATSKNGAAGVLNVTPGDVTVQVTATGKTCAPIPIIASTGSSANLKLLAGWFSYTWFTCK